MAFEYNHTLPRRDIKKKPKLDVQLNSHILIKRLKGAFFGSRAHWVFINSCNNRIGSCLRAGEKKANNQIWFNTLRI